MLAFESHARMVHDCAEVEFLVARGTVAWHCGQLMPCWKAGIHT